MKKEEEKKEYKEDNIERKIIKDIFKNHKFTKQINKTIFNKFNIYANITPFVETEYSDSIQSLEQNNIQLPCGDYLQFIDYNNIYQSEKMLPEYHDKVGIIAADIKGHGLDALIDSIRFSEVINTNLSHHFRYNAQITADFFDHINEAEIVAEGNYIELKNNGKETKLSFLSAGTWPSFWVPKDSEKPVTIIHPYFTFSLGFAQTPQSVKKNSLTVKGHTYHRVKTALLKEKGDWITLSDGFYDSSNSIQELMNNSEVRNASSIGWDHSRIFAYDKKNYHFDADKSQTHKEYNVFSEREKGDSLRAISEDWTYQYILRSIAGVLHQSKNLSQNEIENNLINLSNNYVEKDDKLFLNIRIE